MTISHTMPWSTPTPRTSGIAAASINAGATTVGDAITPGGDTHADITLTYGYGVAPTAGAPIQVRIYESDGTNYDSVTGRLVSQVPAVADTTTRYRTFTGVPIGPSPFKIAVTNGGAAQALTATVTVRTYRQAVEPA